LDKVPTLIRYKSKQRINMNLNRIKTVAVDYSNPQQASELVELMDIYAQDPMGGGTALLAEIKSQLASALEKAVMAYSFICYVEGKAVGLINCIEGFSTFNCKPLLNIHDLVVLDRYRGIGVSQSLLARAEVFAKEKGCCKLTLEVLEGNEIAKNAYLKFGFDGYELDPQMGKALFWQKKL
jgi:GNAT superfamily N-acetyltransferase